MEDNYQPNFEEKLKQSLKKKYKALGFKERLKRSFKKKSKTPRAIISLCKVIVDELPNNEAEVIEAIPLDADLSKVFPKWAILMLKRIRPIAPHDRNEVIDKAISLFSQPIVDHGLLRSLAREAMIDLESGYLDSSGLLAVRCVVGCATNMLWNDYNTVPCVSFAFFAGDSALKQKEDLLNLLKNAKKVQNGK